MGKCCASNSKDVGWKLADKLAFILAHIVHTIMVIHLVWVDSNQNRACVSVDTLTFVTASDVFQQGSFVKVTESSKSENYLAATVKRRNDKNLKTTDILQMLPRLQEPDITI